MWTDTPKTLSEIKNKNNILNLNQKNILELTRIWTIEQLKLISESKEVNWINNKKVLNNDTIEIAKFIVEKIDTVLNMNINEIKDKKIENLVKKIWDKLTESEDIEDFLIWTYIQKVSNQISKINLRYERKLNFINATTDNLTWLYNRVFVNPLLDKLISNYQRYWIEFSVLIVDIDFFKNINDTLWHNAWDIILQKIAQLFKDNLRIPDIISRWWWEEFVLILPKTSNNTAIIVWEKIRKCVENELWKNINQKEDCKSFHIYWNECNEWSTPCIKKITCSIWVATINKINDKTETKEELLKRADKALYIAKHNWRNMVCNSETKKED